MCGRNRQEHPNSHIDAGNSVLKFQLYCTHFATQMVLHLNLLGDPAKRASPATTPKRTSILNKHQLSNIQWDGMSDCVYEVTAKCDLVVVATARHNTAETL